MEQVSSQVSVYIQPNIMINSTDNLKTQETKINQHQ